MSNRQDKSGRFYSNAKDFFSKSSLGKYLNILDTKGTLLYFFYRYEAVKLVTAINNENFLVF